MFIVGQTWLQALMKHVLLGIDGDERQNQESVFWGYHLRGTEGVA